MVGVFSMKMLCFFVCIGSVKFSVLFSGVFYVLVVMMKVLLLRCVLFV